jgi:hypothetical protein
MTKDRTGGGFLGFFESKSIFPEGCPEGVNFNGTKRAAKRDHRLIKPSSLVTFKDSSFRISLPLGMAAIGDDREMCDLIGG